MLFDTGVVYATLDRADAWHQRSVALVAGLAAPPRMPVTILPEVCYLARTSLGAGVEHAFVSDLAAGNFEVEPLQDRDVSRADQLMARYTQIGFVDATVIAIAERLRIETLATVDHLHFATVQPQHVERFTLVP